MFSTVAATSIDEGGIGGIIVSVVENAFLPVRKISFLALPICLCRTSGLLCTKRGTVGRIRGLTTISIVPAIASVPVISIIPVVRAVSIVPVVSIVPIWGTESWRGSKSRYHDAQD